MIDIFSSEFLMSIKQQSKCRVRTSKALLDAIKDLTITNQNNKKKISQMQLQIQTLKQQNMILMQMMQTNKLDYQNRIQLKDKKVQTAINIEARLYAQNQGLKKQVDKLRQQLQLFRNIPIQSMQSMTSLSKDREELQRNQNYNQNQNQNQNQINVLDKYSRTSDNDLNAYLFSQKDKTSISKSRNKQIFQQDKQHDISLDDKMKDNQIKKVQRQTMHKSHYFPSNTNLGRSEIFNKILNDDFS